MSRGKDRSNVCRQPPFWTTDPVGNLGFTTVELNRAASALAADLTDHVLNGRASVPTTDSDRLAAETNSQIELNARGPRNAKNSIRRFLSHLASCRPLSRLTARPRFQSVAPRARRVTDLRARRRGLEFRPVLRRLSGRQGCETARSGGRFDFGLVVRCSRPVDKWMNISSWR